MASAVKTGQADSRRDHRCLLRCISFERNGGWTHFVRPCLAKTWQHWLFERTLFGVCFGVAVKRHLPNKDTVAILNGTQWALPGVKKMINEDLTLKGR